MKSLLVGSALAVTILSAGCMPSYQVVESSEARTDCLQQSEESPILWFSPIGDGENRALEEWCRNNGPPVVKADPTGDFLSAGTDSIDVLVWNVEAGDGWVRQFLKDNTDIECAGPNSTIKRGGLHFALLTQESLRRSNEIPEGTVPGGLLPRVGGHGHPDPLIGIVEVAAQCGLSIFYLPGSRNGADAFDGLREDKGNAILSTLPLSDFAGIELPFESVRRIATVATATTSNGSQVRLASVHVITTPPPWRVITTGNSARARQSLGLVDGLQQIETVFGEVSVIAAGDLNTFSNHETSMRKLRKYFADSPPPLGVPTRGPVQADHILLRRSAFVADGGDHIIPGSYTRVEELYFSDHNPVRARLRFKN
jgi:endonuclease/exonuclease/phosphatase family metal-dependent hydrolase